ncbi:hypothetical protein [Gymnodinialimonas ceratoperidinii]|uniref:Uncharacterized protein n=1 Tax=Gymnodinialimonas ceratoperidinii TaxID=2856823 RepID=A0A8F6TVJ5_9RHOB|nr:hypothetical protein [Gymnodinialimonas ceratoperidinii]QXT38688.1 hypothetical protein KYE46_12165 [Gymnodinialimonas ceratoperidinii]
MIRTAALFCFFALSAAAQDFRGLLPGMPTAELARLGEPFELQTAEGRTVARYPLPYERQLHVVHGGGRILSLGLGAIGAQMRPPQSDGLTVGESTLAQTRAAAGSEGSPRARETETIFAGEVSVDWTLFFDLPDHPDLTLETAFVAPDRTLSETSSTLPPAPPADAILIAASLHHADYIAAHPDIFGADPVDETDAPSFATPLAEAFPRLQMP